MDGHRIRSLRFGDAKVKPAARGVFLPEYRPLEERPPLA
jgi:hypothetical protein